MNNSIANTPECLFFFSVIQKLDIQSACSRLITHTTYPLSTPEIQNKQFQLNQEDQGRELPERRKLGNAFIIKYERALSLPFRSFELIVMLSFRVKMKGGRNPLTSEKQHVCKVKRELTFIFVPFMFVPTWPFPAHHCKPGLFAIPTPSIFNFNAFSSLF